MPASIVGYEQLTVSTASIGFAAIDALAKSAIVTVSTAAIRYRQDETAPTSGVGYPIDVGKEFIVNGGLSAFRAIRSGGSNATLDILYFDDELDVIPGGAATSATVGGAVQLAAGSAAIGSVIVTNMPPTDVTTDDLQATLIPYVAGDGLLIGPGSGRTQISAATTNATSVKASAGKVYWIYASNINAAVRYLKVYNKASAPTVGTDVPVLTLAIPGNTAGGGFILPASDMGVKFATGIATALTTGSADADTAAVAAGDILVSMGYF